MFRPLQPPYPPTTHLLPRYYPATTQLLPPYYPPTTHLLSTYYPHTTHLLSTYYPPTTILLPTYIVAKKWEPGNLVPSRFSGQIRKVEARLGKLAKIRKVETNYESSSKRLGKLEA